MLCYKILLFLALGGQAIPLPDGTTSQCSPSYQGTFGFVVTKPGSSSGSGWRHQTQNGATQISDDQVQNGATQIGDGQAQNTASQASDGQAQSGSSPTTCLADNSLQLTLSNGILKDNKRRQGYLASNYQFQFDNPPQASHLDTSSFSVCGNLLALNGNTRWWQCKSSDFYNLYSKNWLAQCEPVTFMVVGFKNC